MRGTCDANDERATRLRRNRCSVRAGDLAGGRRITVAMSNGRTRPWGRLAGTATKFAFQFPHVFFEMTVEAGRRTSTWSITTRWTPTILREHGWSRESIKPGDKISVTYLPHVDKPRVGQMQTIEVNGKALPLSF